MATFRLPRSQDSVISFSCSSGWDPRGDKFEFYVENQAGTAQFSYTGATDFDVDSNTVRVLVQSGEMQLLTASTVNTTSAAASETYYYIKLVGYDVLGRRYVLSNNNPLLVYDVSNYLYNNPAVSINKPTDWLAGAGYFDYYIDSIDGDDSNAGTSISAPYQTISALPDPILAGTKIALRRGSYWREELRLKNDGCTVAAYGTGTNNPTLDARGSIGTWSLHGAGTATYSASLTFAGSETGITSNVNAWQSNGRRLKLGGSAATLNEGEFYVDSHTNGSTTIYVRQFGGAQPGFCDVTVRHGAIVGKSAAGADTDQHTLVGLTCYAGTNEGGTVSLGDYCTVINCTLDHGSKHVANMGNGTYARNCTFASWYYGSGSSNSLVLYADTLNGSDSLIENCTFQHAGGNYPVSSSSDYIYGHGTNPGAHGTVTLRGCTFVGAYDGTNRTKVGGTFSAALLLFDDCTFSGAFDTIFNILGNPVTIQNSTVTMEVASSSIARLATVDYSTFVFTGNTVCLTATATANSGFIFANGNADNSIITVTNNDWYTALVAAGVILVDVDGTGGTTTFTGNRVHGQDNAVTVLRVDITGGVTLDSDNNIYKHDNYDFQDKTTTSYATLALWQSGESQDLNSTTDSTLDLSGQC